jgi:hypothetical protein
MTSPTPSSTFTGSSVTFNWTAGSGTNWWIDVGSSPGGNQYLQSGSLNVQTATVSGLPTDSSAVYVTLYTLIGGVWVSNAYTYTAWNGSSGLATMASPTPGPISGSTQTFTWNAGTNATNYWIDIGNVAGGNQYYQSGSLSSTTLSQTVYTLPADGSQIFVTLYSYIGGQWLSNSYTYISGP